MAMTDIANNKFEIEEIRSCKIIDVESDEITFQCENDEQRDKLIDFFRTRIPHHWIIMPLISKIPSCAIYQKPKPTKSGHEIALELKNDYKFQWK